MNNNSLTDTLKDRITDEIFMAFKLSPTGWLRKAFGHFFNRPAQRFGSIFSKADEAIGMGGMSEGCRVVVREFGIDLEVSGAENIPTSGPAIIISNHPGAYDSVSIGSLVKRTDLKIIAWQTQVYRAMPYANQQFLYAKENSSDRMLVIRHAIEHLRKGGIILQFGSGLIEPDPAIMPNTEESLKDWSPSIEIMLRKVPQTRLIQTVVSGVLLKRFAKHPLTHLVRGGVNQRRVAEFTQIIAQLRSPASVKIKTQISFTVPITLAELSVGHEERRILPIILARQEQLLSEHLKYFGL